MLDDKLRELTKSIDMLPPLPAVMRRLLDVARDEDSDAEDMGAVISTDQAFTSRLLKLVNSSFYGFSHQISTISKAVVVLGFEAVKNLALGVGVFEELNKTINNGVLDIKKFWQHSIVTAVIAKLLAEKSGYHPAEEAFVAGLVHDSGKLFLAMKAPKVFEAVMEQAKNEPGRDLCEVERDLLAIDHAILGTNIFKHWRFPENLLRAVRCHHNLELGASPEIGKIESITCLANSMAKICNIGSSGNDVFPIIPKRMMDILGVSEDVLLRILLELDSELDKAAQLLRIDLQNDIGYRKSREGNGKVLLIGVTPRRVRPKKLVLQSAGYDVASYLTKELTSDIVNDASPDILLIDATETSFDKESLNNDILSRQNSLILCAEPFKTALLDKSAVVLAEPFTVRNLLDALAKLKGMKAVAANGRSAKI